LPLGTWYGVIRELTLRRVEHRWYSEMEVADPFVGSIELFLSVIECKSLFWFLVQDGRDEQLVSDVLHLSVRAIIALFE